MSDPASVTAALLVIGDEILSGRTKDKNIGYIAEYLTNIGIELREVRVVPDVVEEIVAAVNALRARYRYLFTTGGIGPTHDDITADCVAAAFGVPIDVDPRAVELLLQRYKDRSELTEARLRMARIPEGADLVANPITKAPGFMIGNVIVMAGVPSIMQAMLEDVTPRLVTGVVIESRSIDAKGLPEGLYGTELGAIAKNRPGVSIGSYPHFGPGGFENKIVLRGRDTGLLDVVAAEVEAMIATIAATRST
jgi:molybdenum cofactor synthesis domain-containing protein